MAYEYLTDFFEISYDTGNSSDLLDRPIVPVDPDALSYINNEQYLAILARRGDENWELVTVTPLLRGVYHVGHQFSYPLTAGFFYHWRRVKEIVTSV